MHVGCVWRVERVDGRIVVGRVGWIIFRQRVFLRNVILKLNSLLNSQEQLKVSLQ